MIDHTHDDDIDILPPAGPPPLLDFNQARHLAYHGWLPISLSSNVLAESQSIFHASETFFNQPLGAKQALYPAQQGTEFGYYHVPDEKEYVTFRRAVYTSETSGSATATAATDINNILSFESSVSNFWHDAAHLLHRILCDLASAGYLSRSIWDRLLSHSLSFPPSTSSLDEIISLLRVFRYEPHRGIADPHVDIGLLTLCIGNGRGLQVWNCDIQQYVDVDGPVVLVGDMTRALLRNRVRAGKHRVVSTAEGRGSLVFALRPCLKYEVDLRCFGGEGVVNTREYFGKIKGPKYSVNATKDVRQQQQSRQEALRGMGNAPG